MRKAVNLVENGVLESARRTIETERRGLEALERALSDGLAGPFSQAVETIGGISGRVIVTGVGKSGHIGAKLAATFASTGTPAFFVHAAEANHGDLGMIAQGRSRPCHIQGWRKRGTAQHHFLHAPIFHPADRDHVQRALVAGDGIRCHTADSE